MTLRTWLGCSGALVALLATGALFSAQGGPGVEPLALEPDGIGPLRLGRGYDDAVAAARVSAPESAFAGLGCNGLDEVRYSGRIAALPVSAMAMARDGAIAEVELTLDAPLQASDENACIALRDEFAAPFFSRFGAATESWTEQKPVSREHMLQVGPVQLVARWFQTGRTCYVSAHYGITRADIERERLDQLQSRR